MIEVFNDQITRNVQGLILNLHHILDIFNSINFTIWQIEFARLNVDINTVKNGELEYMVIDIEEGEMCVGYIKGHFSVVKRKNKVQVYDFTENNYAFTNTDDYIVEKINNYLEGELTDDKINALHDDLSAFVDNVIEHLKLMNLSSCWPTIKLKSANK